jgi:hypothetical protein
MSFLFFDVSRMVPVCQPISSQLEHLRAIHLQGLYRRSACRCQAQNSRTIIAPGKMFRPMITGGVKEWRFSASGWINRMRSYGLMSITAWATQTKIFDQGLSTL